MDPHNSFADRFIKRNSFADQISIGSWSQTRSSSEKHGTPILKPRIFSSHCIQSSQAMPVAPAVTDQLAAPWIGEPNTIRGGAEGSMGSKPASRPRTAAAAAAAMQLSR